MLSLCWQLGHQLAEVFLTDKFSFGDQNKWLLCGLTGHIFFPLHPPDSDTLLMKLFRQEGPSDDAPRSSVPLCEIRNLSVDAGCNFQSCLYSTVFAPKFGLIFPLEHSRPPCEQYCSSCDDVK